MKTRNVIGWIARIFVAVVFMASAVTKYISIDAFDQFIYEHQLFSWITTTILTRILIACEFGLGLLLLVGIKPKLVKSLIIAFLVFFSIYIIAKPYLFHVDKENCHCFGEVLIMSDSQTLIKNIVLLFFSYFMFWNKGVVPNDKNEEPVSSVPEEKKSKTATISSFIRNNTNYLFVVISVAVLLLSFGINMPDSLRYKLYGKAAKINEEKFEYLISNESLEDLHIKEGKKIVCMYSPVCKFCKKTAKRLDVMRQKYNIKDENFALIFWGGEKAIDKFFTNNEIKPLPFKNVPAPVFLEATKGRQPVIILMNNGKVEKLLKYPNIIDEDIVKFLNK